jgi:hypothetical protein
MYNEIFLRLEPLGVEPVAAASGFGLSLLVTGGWRGLAGRLDGEG